MRKRVFLLVLVIMLLCTAPVQVFALETNSENGLEMGPLWVNITSFVNASDITGSGIFEFETRLYARSNIDKVVIDASIQQYNNGSWQTIKSWTSTSYSSSGSMYQNWAVMSGYYYRLVSTGLVYQNNVLMEQTSYTGPSYWY